MVLQKAQNSLNNLKERPKEDKKVVAGGIAIAIVALLFIGWGILFLKKIQDNPRDLEFATGAQDEFLPTTVRDSQDELLRGTTYLNELEAAREESAARRVETSGSYQGDTNYQESSNPFGTQE